DKPIRDDRRIRHGLKHGHAEGCDEAERDIQLPERSDLTARGQAETEEQRTERHDAARAVAVEQPTHDRRDGAVEELVQSVNAGDAPVGPVKLIYERLVEELEERSDRRDQAHRDE